MDLCEQAPSYIRAIAPYQPGKPISELARELGLDERKIVKLASNENPFGISPKAKAAIKKGLAELARYPDGNAFELKAALARRHGVPQECIVVGNGSNDLLELAAAAFLTPGRAAVYSQHAFAVYPLATQARGATGIVVPARNYAHDLEAMLAAITERTKLVFIAAPNNPTGTTNDRAELDAYFERVPPHVLTVLDQAYFEYVDGTSYPDGVAEYLARGHRVLVLRTFSKIFGLAGLRVGYGIGPADVITAIGKVRRAFDVTSIGQEAALASIHEEAEIARRRAANKEAMALLHNVLREHALEPAGPAVANFLFVRVGDAEGLNEALLRRGVIVRPMGSFGAPDALRITAGTPEEVAFLGDALAALDAPVGAAPR